MINKLIIVTMSLFFIATGAGVCQANGFDKTVYLKTALENSTYEEASIMHIRTISDYVQFLGNDTDKDILYNLSMYDMVDGQSFNSRCSYTAELNQGKVKFVEVSCPQHDFSRCAFINGDCNGDTVINISDIIAIVNGQYLSGPKCVNNEINGDANADHRIDISDAMWISGFLFQGTKKPPIPIEDCQWNIE